MTTRRLLPTALAICLAACASSGEGPGAEEEVGEDEGGEEEAPEVEQPPLDVGLARYLSPGTPASIHFVLDGEEEVRIMNTLVETLQEDLGGGLLTFASFELRGEEYTFAVDFDAAAGEADLLLLQGEGDEWVAVPPEVFELEAEKFGFGVLQGDFTLAWTGRVRPTRGAPELAAGSVYVYPFHIEDAETLRW